MVGIANDKFYHYAFDAGENKGEAPTFFSKSELDRTRNVENRGNGLVTRYGSSVLNVDGSGYPSPISGNNNIKSIFYFPYDDPITHEVLFTSDDKIYRDPASPTSLKSGLTAGLRFQGAKAAEIFYLTNGTDDVQFYDPDRSTTQTYPAGYDQPSAFTAADNTSGTGSVAPGTYEYYVTWYDENTLTESNPQAAAVSVTVTGDSVQLSNLPIDSNSRTTHWRIYRKDPSGIYYYRHVETAYTPGTPTYLDEDASTGQSYTVATDNFKPDPSTVICLHGSQMIYCFSNTVTWSKSFRYQNVPTFNRENLFDESAKIVRAISFRGSLVIFKTNSIYVINGSLEDQTYEVRKISSRIGTLSPDSVAESPDGIFFLDNNKRPRFINSTDFDYEDLRDSTDISYKYRKKFDIIPFSGLENCHGVVWETSAVKQYRVYVPIDSSSNIPNHAYVFDYGLASRNEGDSGWFDFRYNFNLDCSVALQTGTGDKFIYTGDDYGLLWKTEDDTQYYDGDEFWREEGDGSITINVGSNTIDLPDVTMGVNQYAGMQIILYDQYTFDVILRDRVTSNTATQFTLENTIPTLATADPAVTVGGYLTYFATAHYTHDRAGRNRPFKASVLFSQEIEAVDVHFFTHYDFNETFQYTYDYINNTSNNSRTPKADVYLLNIELGVFVYDGVDAVYDTGTYGLSKYGTAEFLLNAYYLFQHVSWGIVTREPSKPFGYVGATLYYQAKELMR